MSPWFCQPLRNVRVTNTHVHVYVPLVVSIYDLVTIQIMEFLLIRNVILYKQEGYYVISFHHCYITWWRLFLKRVLRTKFGIYAFIHIINTPTKVRYLNSLLQKMMSFDYIILNTHFVYDLKRNWRYLILFYQRTKYTYQEVIRINR
jgi:hypothetical protein